MKKTVVISMILTLVLIAFCACSAETESSVSESITSSTKALTTERVTSTTALASDSEKAEELKADISSYFDNNGELSVNDEGGFTYKNPRDPQIMYSSERDESAKAQAKANAEKLISFISTYYPYEIIEEEFKAVQIGEGDNGVDSVRYEAYYTNDQNQQLVLYMDSDAVISYIDCTLTW